MFPKGSIPIPNDYGTAPGFMIERQGAVALFFPGVPRELIRMIRERGIPEIVKRFGSSNQIFKTRTLHAYGLSESKLGEILEDISGDEEGFHLAFLPRFPIIRLRMDSWGVSEDQVTAKLEQVEQAIRDRISENIISSDGRHMEQVVLALLEERGLSLTLAESITGGMIGEMITRVPGSSRTFMGSIVSYSNDMKSSVLRVSEETLSRDGAVSHRCAREMAIGARNVGKSDIGLSVTGIAGPDGGTPEKPVGTFIIGLATADAVLSRGFLLPGERGWVTTLAATQSLDLLRRHLLGLRVHGDEEG
jgi:nicotinamide-nucleotide amidase